MITIKNFAVSPIEENTYIVSDQTGEAVIVDCGCFVEDEWSKIKEYICKNELKPVHLVCTHMHFDHVMGNKLVFRDYGLKPEANDADLVLYKNMGRQLKMFMGVSSDEFVDMPPLARALREADVIPFGTHQLEVLETPGHSPGGLCFYCKDENVLFTGDTLFQCSIGRTDLEGGSYRQLIGSIRDKIAVLPGETAIYPGHGPSSILDSESRYNPYF
ncbi:MAG: MBL fold metallo-hydrolase [Bacteroides sp.]|nr:MBL fold metallo-hydrolase [Roseburia sp.]MCM1346712.1 MBL fold metallo-hydrolase [Bacteroides sp.]MCM1421463.1 MBL fold metallo-hydrolase [Bacteroides sp.]